MQERKPQSVGLGKVVIDRAALEAGVERLAAAVAGDYAGHDPLFVGILKGSVFFLADLTRKIPFPSQIEFLTASSYGGSSTSSGEVRITADIVTDLRGRDVILVEDIIDTGLTIRHIFREFASRGAASVKVCALLRKKTAKNGGTPADYVGFEIDDTFVVGYGLDYDERYRNLPEIHEFEPNPQGKESQT